jgi:glycosyltransferase involved in cell wall biosynthesis
MANPQLTFETVLVKLLGYGVFWNGRARQRFRSKAFSTIIRVRTFVWRSSVKSVPRSEGERLVERRISIFGIPVFVRRSRRPYYRVALLVDEFFGGWDSAIGGYGALARNYICRFVPNEAIQIDLLLDARGGVGVQQKLVDHTMIYRLPAHPLQRQKWLDNQAFDLFLSIEMTWPSFEIIRDYETNVPVLFWIQDPRHLAMYQLRLRAVHRLKDSDWAYVEDVSAWLQEMIKRKRVFFISQGESLSKIAREAYGIPDTVPIVELANPVKIESNYKLDDLREPNKIIFLGRLEAQKRAWMFCEIAMAMPHYEFYVLGATGRGRGETENAKSLEEYRNPDGGSKIENLHFVGHVDGDTKDSHIKTAKLLVNTSFWEGIPVSWLEALSYGTLIVSAFDRDNIVGRFGTFVGEVMGDGTDEASIKAFADAIEYWLTRDFERRATAQKAMDFVRDRHSIAAFTDKMRAEILRRIR